MGELGKALASVAAAKDQFVSDLAKSTGIPFGGANSNPASQMPALAPAGSLLAPTPEMQAAASVAATPSANPYDNIMNSPALAPAQPETPETSEESQPYNNPYTPADDNPIEVVGDPWQPKGPGWLGDIMDTLLMLKGKPPVFRLRKNYPEILKGFTQGGEKRDQAIRRMQQVYGPAAWDMAREDAQMDAADALAMQRRNENFIKAGEVAGSMLEASKGDPEAYAKALPLAQGIISRIAGPDGSDLLLPREYDKEKINAVIGMALSPYQARTLDQNERQIKQLGEHRALTREETTRHNQATEGETRRNNDVDNALGEKKFIVSQRDNKGIQTILGPDRKPRGSISPDGTKAKIQAPDGRVFRFQLLRPWDLSSRVPVRDEEGKPILDTGK